MNQRNKKQRIAKVIMLFLFALIFMGVSATSVEAVKSCDAKPEARVGAPFLIAGCPSVKIGGETIPCYHSPSGIVFALLQAYKLLLGVVGSLALLMFVWGGFLWLTSAGTEKRITSGMTTLKNAVIGLLIVFGAWVGVNFIVSTLTQGTGKLAFRDASEQWWQMKKSPLCYRALTAAELATALAAPVKVTITPPTVPSGTACRGETPNARSCRSDCECISGNCYQGFCVGGGLDVSEVFGGCCAVTVSGGKLSHRRKLENCKQFLQKEFQATPPRIKNTPAYFCPFPTNRLGATESEVCWNKPFTAGDYTIGKECETVKEPVSL